MHRVLLQHLMNSDVPQIPIVGLGIILDEKTPERYVSSLQFSYISICLTSPVVRYGNAVQPSYLTL